MLLNSNLWKSDSVFTWKNTDLSEIALQINENQSVRRHV